MSSEVAICNMALHRVRGKKIGALNEPTVEASACNDFYAESRDFVLSDFPWNFAGKTVALGQKVEEPLEWAFCYGYPNDCLKIRYLRPESKFRHHQDPIEYEVGLAADNSKAILTNLDEAYLRYTFTLTNVNHFDTHFRIALSWYLASEIAIPVAGTAKGRVLADRAFSGYNRSILAAYSANANEDEPGEQRDPESIRAHR